MKPKLPKGWRFVESGERIMAGDKFLSEATCGWEDCRLSVGSIDDGKAPRVIRKIQPKTIATKPPENRWHKFTGKAPKFTDPAEAVFDVKLTGGNVACGCVWAQTGNVTGFHCISMGSAVPIDRECITHWRRA